VGRMRDFKHEMEQLSGKTIADNELFHAIEVYNKNRALLQKVVALRRSDPPRISGSEALQIIGAGMFIPKEEHNKLLELLLQEIDMFHPKKGVRLFVSGSMANNTEVFELIESCGAVIVGDDICTGDRYTEDMVELLPDPIEALASRYLFKAPCPRIVPLPSRVKDFSQRLENCRPQGAVFYLYTFCDSNMWDYVALRNELEKFDIPHYYLDQQEYRLTNPESVRTRVEALIESIG